MGISLSGARTGVLASVVAAVSLSLTVPATGAQVADVGAAPLGVTWIECEDESFVDLGFECGSLEVPMDRSRPALGTVTLALTRLAHTSSDEDYQGIMLINPGGPGGSGLIMPVISYFLPDPDTAAAYDWIGFDPRGVGSSTPQVTCDPFYGDGPRPQYNPTTRAIEWAWRNRAKGYARDCVANGEILRHVRTTDNVADMESIRQALGQKKLNFYGYSYGSYLGQVYATLHPDRVRRMVLDSNVQASRVWEQANYDQNVAFEKVMKIWFDWLAEYRDVYQLGATGAEVEALWYKTRDALASNPAGGLIGPAEFTDAFLGAGYVQFLWPALGTAFAAWVNDGDATGLIENYSYDDNLYAMYLATECTDARWQTRWPPVRAQNTRLNRTSPFNTWGNAWFNAPCMTWPATPSKPVRVDGRRVAPILLVDETLDGATPFEGSLEARRLFPNSSLIALPGGTSHAISPSGNECLDTQIAAYLADGTLPARKPGRGPDATCDPLPRPTPDELGRAAARGATQTAPMTREELWQQAMGR
jgi:pimeloyl-ACP methyl ester carboxylesterase